MRHTALVLMLVLALAGCATDETPGGVSPTSTGDETPDDAATGAQRFPDVLDVELTPADDGTYTAAVTLSSPYDTPERYADAWRLLGPDGTELGVRELTHDHAAEQPFTRSQSGIVIPEGVTEVVAEGRDLVHGWGGATVTVAVP